MTIRTLWGQLAQDLLYAVRTLAANPLFASMAVLSLALGIGANTAIYSFMEAILMRSLPVQNPESLVVFKWHSKDFRKVAHGFNGSNYHDPKTGLTSGNFPYPAFESMRADETLCSSVFGFSRAGGLNLVIQGQADRAQGQYVTGSFFSGLGLHQAPRCFHQRQWVAGCAHFVIHAAEVRGVATVREVNYRRQGRRNGGKREECRRCSCRCFPPG